MTFLWAYCMPVFELEAPLSSMLVIALKMEKGGLVLIDS